MVNRDDERINGWVDERIGSLVAGVVAPPDAGVALNRLRARHRVKRMASRRWIGSTSVAGAWRVLRYCVCRRRGLVCRNRVLVCREFWGRRRRRVPDRFGSRCITACSKRTGPVMVAAPGEFPKSEGAADAPMILEVYIGDYDCIHCATFVRQVLPELRRQYIATGQLRLVWRDFPLPTHRFAMLAARYADAAGALGYYDAAREQIFATREEWDANGDVDGALAAAPPQG